MVAFVTVAAFVLGAAAIVTSPYRAKRFLAFLDPWSDPYDTGYQATLAIMALPRAACSAVASATRR
ncbi:MAG: FtsW/RodA/SpoVE family cell cycle protein [Collinsella intestinalis]